MRGMSIPFRKDTGRLGGCRSVSINKSGFSGDHGARLYIAYIITVHSDALDHQPFFSERSSHLRTAITSHRTKNAVIADDARRDGPTGLPAALVVSAFNGSYKITPMFFLTSGSACFQAVPFIVLWFPRGDARGRGQSAARSREPGYEPEPIISPRECRCGTPLGSPPARRFCSSIHCPINAPTTASLLVGRVAVPALYRGRHSPAVVAGRSCCALSACRS